MNDEARIEKHQKEEAAVPQKSRGRKERVSVDAHAYKETYRAHNADEPCYCSGCEAYR